MSKQSKLDYIESCRARYPSRNRAGKSAMIDEVSDTLGLERKHTIKVLNGHVSLGQEAKKRGAKPIYGEAEKLVIVTIWKSSEQPCSTRLKEMLPLWLNSYERRHGKLESKTRQLVLSCSSRQLDRITKDHRAEGSGRIGRKVGRRSHRIKQSIEIKIPGIF
ncbi:hypothetical protein JIN82_15140 [Persicirhabdus sediminis]|uniref:Uncharacterized protein n=2 Tax=Persicirhabdus sediminis TaxID=454144 RepID=A0A8J7SPQ6_9BACT|nr:hypothetical protein [Persicirhabdus sediminis]